MKLNVSIKKAGPFLSGQFERTMPGVIDEIDKAGAEYALHALNERFDDELMHPTGRYQSHLQIEKTELGAQVNDGTFGKIYGAWLEGVASRNRRSRFKGYATFRKVSQQVRIHAIEIANKAIEAFVAKMNG